MNQLPRSKCHAGPRRGRFVGLLVVVLAGLAYLMSMFFTESRISQGVAAAVFAISVVVVAIIALWGRG